jgi:hypothetical protein
MKFLVLLSITFSSVFATAMIGPQKEFNPNDYPPTSVELVCRVPWTRPFENLSVSTRYKLMELCAGNRPIVDPDEE